MSRPCDYSDTPPAPTTEDIVTLQLKLFELESRLKCNGSDRSLDDLDTHSESMSRSSHTPQPLPIESLWEGSACAINFPSAAFLDNTLFKNAGSYIPRPLFNIPAVSPQFLLSHFVESRGYCSFVCPTQICPQVILYSRSEGMSAAWAISTRCGCFEKSILDSYLVVHY